MLGTVFCRPGREALGSSMQPAALRQLGCVQHAGRRCPLAQHSKQASRLAGCSRAPLAAHQTAPAGSVTQSAQPLPKQAYDKNKVWLLLLGGAASLFGVTLLIEGQSGLFPAIARSNQILRMSADEREAARAAALDQVTDDQLEAAVMSGITKSRARQDAPGLNNGGGNGQDEDLQRPVIDVESSDRQPDRPEDKIPSELHN